MCWWWLSRQLFGLINESVSVSHGQSPQPGANRRVSEQTNRAHCDLSSRAHSSQGWPVSRCPSTINACDCASPVWFDSRLIAGWLVGSGAGLPINVPVLVR